MVRYKAYDAISQTIATTAGDNYTISFQAMESNGSQTTFSSVSTGSLQGIDLLAYAQAGLPAADVPEPAGVLILAPGLLGLLALRRRAV